MPKFTSISNLASQAYQSLLGEPFNAGIGELGTRTLNNRDFWENNNFNESTLTPYLTDNKATLQTQVMANGIVFLSSIANSVLYQYSIDTLPFVTDPNNSDEIIRLDEYHDKIESSNEYYLATEGKINYHIYPRLSGRPTPDGEINNYQFRARTNRFDSYASQPGDTGYYLFKLNWGDGTEMEYTDNPKLLESSLLLEHTYEKPGFYTISGIVYALYSPEDQQSIGGYEKFETNILLNPSKNYELNLYDYDNFATIGGITNDSVLVKSAVNLVGINPLDFSDEKANPELIKDINLLDRLQLFNFLNKVSGSYLNKFEDFLQPFTQAFIEEGGAVRVVGCMNENANNYNPNANYADGSCNFDFNVTFAMEDFQEGDEYIIYTIYKTINGIAPSTIPIETDTRTIDDNYFTEDQIIENSPNPFTTSINTSEILGDTDNTIRLFIQFQGYGNGAEPTSGFRQGTGSPGFLLPITVVSQAANNQYTEVSGWYRLKINNPSSLNYEDKEFIFNRFATGNTNEEQDENDTAGDIVTQSGLTATEDDSLYILDEENGVDFTQLYTGLYHIHDSGVLHVETNNPPIINGEVHAEGDVITTIVDAAPPTNTYVVILHNKVHDSIETTTSSGTPITLYRGAVSKVRFMGYPSNQHWLGGNLGNTGSPSNAASSTGTDKYAISIPYDGIEPEERAGLEAGQAVWASNNSDGGTITSSPFLDELGVRIEGKLFRPEASISWDGWYSDPNFTNRITTEEQYAIRLGNASLDGGIGVGVQQGNSSTYIINLYAKTSTAF